MQPGAATFLFWKIIANSPYDMSTGECQIRNPVSHCFLPPPHKDAWSFVHPSFFFFFHLGELHCSLLLLLKVREQIEDCLRGYGVPWEKPSYIKALPETQLLCVLQKLLQTSLLFLLIL